MAEARTTGPRARYREQTRAEIKDAALRQLAEGGTAALALVKIAKELGMSGPALYRYFASRDDLLGALIDDAYADAAAAVAAAPDPGTGPRARLHALATAYRDWAVGEPHRYQLVQGTPTPGYTAPPETLASARAVLAPFLPVFATGTPAPATAPVVAQIRAWLARDEAVAAWVHAGAPAGPEAAATALTGTVLAWSTLHGTIGLEISGHYTGMGHTGETLLTAQTELLADSFALA
ncbi:TetR/AcrR family transcriptional regulator [Kitasatospora sp. NPDC085879]|uniref:TetR/AcrR family transcriptional regulator n=1 Tax=Kitasatospora sp. NPDC085879 TaxID=3154769 RepID=UPI003443BDC3